MGKGKPTEWGDVRMKIASMNGSVTNYAPEYEDCRRIAAEHRVPLKNVMQEAVTESKRAEKNFTELPVEISTGLPKRQIPRARNKALSELTNPLGIWWLRLISKTGI